MTDTNEKNKRVTMKTRLCELLGIDETAKAEIIYAKAFEVLNGQSDECEKKDYFSELSDSIREKVATKLKTLTVSKSELVAYAKSLSPVITDDLEVTKALEIIAQYHKPSVGQSGIADSRLEAAMVTVRKRMDTGEYKPRYRGTQHKAKELGLIPKTAVLKEADTSLQTFENWLNRNPHLREKFT